jgi:hypothetical protein
MPQAQPLAVIQHPVKATVVVQQLQVAILVGVVVAVAEQVVLVVTGTTGTQAMKLLLALQEALAYHQQLLVTL